MRIIGSDLSRNNPCFETSFCSYKSEIRSVAKLHTHISDENDDIIKHLPATVARTALKVIDRITATMNTAKHVHM
jgi:hypothetical protein